MTDPLTDTDLDAMEARCTAATPGPWQRAYYVATLEDQAAEVLTSMRKAEAAGGSDSEVTFVIADHDDEPETGVKVALVGNGPMRRPNQEFIANARTDIPRLLAEVRRLRERCNQRWSVDNYDNRNAPEPADDLPRGDIG